VVPQEHRGEPRRQAGTDHSCRCRAERPGAFLSRDVQQSGPAGRIKSELSTVEDYVNRKALHGLYTLIAEEEHAIRTQSRNAAGSVTGKVFGLLN